MSPRVSGKQLHLWRQEAIKDAITYQVEPKEVDWLLQELSDLDSLSCRLELYKNREEINLVKPLAELEKLWQSRLRESIPVQYLAGRTPWRNFKIKVSPAVLIPRPETEYIIDIALAAVENYPVLQTGIWVDLGTGSGVIACGLAKAFPQAQVYGVDNSIAALKIASDNSHNLGLAGRVKFYQGNWWQPLGQLQGKIAAMVSNPPYIPTKLISQLQPEVFKHEPHSALDGGKDGLRDIRYLIKSAPDYLMPGGLWLIEMMAGQGKIVAKMLENQGSYQNVQTIADLAGKDRFALAYLK